MEFKNTGQLTLHLAKENFKFSVAHFLIFDEKKKCWTAAWA